MKNNKEKDKQTKKIFSTFLSKKVENISPIGMTENGDGWAGSGRGEFQHPNATGQPFLGLEKQTIHHCTSPLQQPDSQHQANTLER